MDIDWSLSRFIFGCIGTLGAEAFRLHKIVTNRSKTPLPEFTWKYFLISGALVAVGGFLAVAWGDNTLWKCVGIGLATPVIISTLTSHFPRS